MTEEISPELFSRLVDLAAFAFDPEEAKYLRRELNNQMKSIQQLALAPLDEKVPLASRGVTYTQENRPKLREDIWEPCQNPDEILGQAPEVEDRYFIVPDIPHTELD